MNKLLEDNSDDSSSDSLSGQEDVMALSMQKVRQIELDIVRILFGKEAVSDYVLIASNNSGVNMQDLKSKFDIQIKEEQSTTTTTLETMDFTASNEGTEANHKRQSRTGTNNSTCCMCCRNSKVVPKNTIPVSQYSVCIIFSKKSFYPLFFLLLIN